MTKDQGYHLIGIAWLALAGPDTPPDLNSIVFLIVSGISFLLAIKHASKS